MTHTFDLNTPYRTRRSMTAAEFAANQARMCEVEVFIAIDHVKTRKGAENIYFAEFHGMYGRMRPNVIGRASRKLDEFNKPRSTTEANLKEKYT